AGAGELDRPGGPVGPGKGCLPAVGVDDEVLARADIDAEGAGADPVEPDAGAVGGCGEVLGDVAAVDLDGVGAVAALVHVAAVAGVPDHPVVALLAEGLVGSGTAGQGVVARPSEEHVAAALAEPGAVPR